VAPPFWRDWYKLVKSVNPRAITVAEIWSDASQWIQDRRVDGTMNYLFARAMKRFFIDQDSSITGSEMTRRLMHIYNRYGDQTSKILWSMLDSHDTDRLASMIVNPDRNYDRDNSPRNNPDYLVRKPFPRERQLQKQIIAFQMTFIGAPVVYYGDEAGMWGPDDPGDRKPMVWPDMNYHDEIHHPLPDHTRPDDPVYFDANLFQYYQSMITIHHQNDALIHGKLSLIPAIEGKSIFGYSRDTDQQQVISIFNRSRQAELVTIPTKQLRYNTYKNALSLEVENRSEQPFQVSVPAQWFTILISQ